MNNFMNYDCNIFLKLNWAGIGLLWLDAFDTIFDTVWPIFIEAKIGLLLIGSKIHGAASANY